MCTKVNYKAKSHPFQSSKSIYLDPPLALLLPLPPPVAQHKSKTVGSTSEHKYFPHRPYSEQNKLHRMLVKRRKKNGRKKTSIRIVLVSKSIQ